MNLHLTKKDFKIDWFSGKGGGGQHRNKHQNCCRITHIESGLTTTGQSHKERPSNQKEAFDKLAQLLIQRYLASEEHTFETSDERIRTYHAERNLVIDHQSGFEQPYTYVVDKGVIDDMIVARKRRD